jgi:Ribbon-helix-helix protein, copG family
MTMADKSMYEQVAEDRAHYLAHPSDEDEWEPAPPPAARAKRRRPPTSMISIRLPGADVDKLRRAADAAGISVSAFVRAAALARAYSNELDAVSYGQYENFGNVSGSLTFSQGVTVSGDLTPTFQASTSLLGAASTTSAPSS